VASKLRIQDYNDTQPVNVILLLHLMLYSEICNVLKEVKKWTHTWVISAMWHCHIEEMFAPKNHSSCGSYYTQGDQLQCCLQHVATVMFWISKTTW